MLKRPENPRATGELRTNALLNVLLDLGCLDTTCAAFAMFGLNYNISEMPENTRKSASAKMTALVEAGLVLQLQDKGRGNASIYYCTKKGAEKVGRLSDYVSAPERLRSTTWHRVWANRFLLVKLHEDGIKAGWSDRQLAQKKSPATGLGKQPDVVFETHNGKLILVEVEHSRRNKASLAKLAEFLERVLPRRYENNPEAGITNYAINGHPVSGVYFVMAPGLHTARNEILRAFANYLKKMHSIEWAEKAFKLAAMHITFVQAAKEMPWFDYLTDTPQETNKAWDAATGATQQQEPEETAYSSDDDEEYEIVVPMAKHEQALAEKAHAEASAYAWQAEAQRLACENRRQAAEIEQLRRESTAAGGVPDHVVKLALDAANARAAKAEAELIRVKGEAEKSKRRGFW